MFNELYVNFGRLQEARALVEGRDKRNIERATLTLNHNFAGSYWKFLYKFAICIPGSIQGGGKTQCTVACALAELHIHFW
jgi:hypothetical protein